MDQAAMDPPKDEADARHVAARLAGPLPVFRPVPRDAQAFWSPGLPPPTVLLGEPGTAFAANFRTLDAADRATAATVVGTAMEHGPGCVGTAVAAGFLEAAIHQAERDGAWPEAAAVPGPHSRALAEAYRSAPFHALSAGDMPAA